MKEVKETVCDETNIAKRPIFKKCVIDEEKGKGLEMAEGELWKKISPCVTDELEDAK